MSGLPSFFGFDDRPRWLIDLGEQLEAFDKPVDFEMFRADLSAARDHTRGPHGGRPPFDPVMMFKILVAEAANNLSDERAEFLANDRLSFMRFLGLRLSDRMPDDLAVQREAYASQGHQAVVCPLRSSGTRLPLYHHVRADRRCHPRP